MNQKGFTLIELIVAVTIFSLLFAASALSISSFDSGEALQVSRQQSVQTLREARTRAVSQFHNDDWSVRLDAVSDPQKLILFKGNNFATRDISFDLETPLRRGVGIQSINLSEGGSDYTFDVKTGETSDYGSFELEAEDRTYEVEVSPLGFVNFEL